MNMLSKLHSSSADVFIPDDTGEEVALARTTHLAIAAHQDDIEIMAFHGVDECYRRPDRWLTGVVVTSGAGSPRVGMYQGVSDLEMASIRKQEQRRAASIGEYAAQIQLGYTSSGVKNKSKQQVSEDLQAILLATRPEIVYLHNPMDRHDTHVAVFLRSVEALRSLPDDCRPQRIYGCEVWRDLDWACVEDKEILQVSYYPGLATSLLESFDSQIACKRYDSAVQGRWQAHATFCDFSSADTHASISFALDMTPLVADHTLTIEGFSVGFIDRFRSEVVERLKRLSQ